MQTGSSNRPRILMVDDDSEFRLPYVRYLRNQYGWDVVEAENGGDALKILDISFHAVVLDEMMPGMRGMLTLRKIRQREDVRSMCVVMLTAARDFDLVTDTSEFEPNAYLQKTKTTPEGLYIALATKLSRNSALLRPVKVFLCHSSADKSVVREIYYRLSSSFVDPWFDEEKLVGGQNWQSEIRREVKASDIVLVCISRQSITRSGFLH